MKTMSHHSANFCTQRIMSTRIIRRHLGLSLLIAIVMQMFFWSICLFVLRFYGPVNPMGSCSSAVSLPNHTFTGQAWSSKRLTSVVHILSPETDNCPAWISVLTVLSFPLWIIIHCRFLPFTVYWETFFIMLGIDILLLADQLEYHRIFFFHTKFVGSDHFL